MRKHAIALAMVLSFSAAAEEQTLASIVMNGKHVADAKELTVDGTTLFMSPNEWAELGVVVPETMKARTRVSSVELGLTVTFDEGNQEYAIKVPARLLSKQTIRTSRPIDTNLSPAPKGVMVGYDLAVSATKSGVKASLAHDARMNLAGGTLYTSGQFNTDKGYQRGLTTWSKDIFDKGLRVQVGDVFATPRNASLGGAVNLGGVRVGTDRALATDAMYPVPVIAGIAETRSSAELLVNGQKALSSEVQPGPYQFEGLYYNNGLNDLAFVVRDEYGRETVVRDQFYVMPTMVRKGEWEWDVSLGKVRQGSSGNNYGTQAVAAQAAYGVNDNWTVSGGIEATSTNKNIQVGTVVSMDTLGALTIGAAKSNNGHAYSVAYERRKGALSMQASHTYQSENYWSLRDENGRDDPWKAKSITSAGVAWANPRTSAALAYSRSVLWNGTKNEAITGRLNYRATPRDQLGLYVSHDLTKKDTTAMVGWRHDFGQVSTQVSHKVGKDPLTAVALTGRARIGEAPVTYALGTDGKQHYADASVELSKGTVSGGIRNGEVRVGATGGLWVGEGGVIATERSYGSYVVAKTVPGAVVDASGTRAKTNRNGVAVISNVGSLMESHVSVSPESLPDDTLLETTDEAVVAPRGGGARVTFPVQSVSFRQYQATWNGQPFAEVGSVKTDLEETLVTATGVFVLEKPEAGMKVLITIKDKSCALTLPTLDTEALSLIPVDCKEEA